jgi:hypothetical protein
MGSIPWIVLQLILVGLLIAFPGMVTSFIGKQKLLDPAAVDQQLRNLAPSNGLDTGAPNFDLGQPPKF